MVKVDREDKTMEAEMVRMRIEGETKAKEEVRTTKEETTTRTTVILSTAVKTAVTRTFQVDSRI